VHRVTHGGANSGRVVGQQEVIRAATARVLSQVAKHPDIVMESLRSSFLHHIFPVPPSQTCTKISAKITGHCTIENCARLQRRSVSKHRLGSLKTEPNETQAGNTQTARGTESCQRGNSVATTLAASCQQSARFLHFCNL